MRKTRWPSRVSGSRPGARRAGSAAGAGGRSGAGKRVWLAQGLGRGGPGGVLQPQPGLVPVALPGRGRLGRRSKPGGLRHLGRAPSGRGAGPRRSISSHPPPAARRASSREEPGARTRAAQTRLTRAAVHSSVDRPGRLPAPAGAGDGSWCRCWAWVTVRRSSASRSRTAGGRLTQGQVAAHGAGRQAHQGAQALVQGRPPGPPGEVGRSAPAGPGPGGPNRPPQPEARRRARPSAFSMSFRSRRCMFSSSCATSVVGAVLLGQGQAGHGGQAGQDRGRTAPVPVDHPVATRRPAGGRDRPGGSRPGAAAPRTGAGWRPGSADRRAPRAGRSRRPAPGGAGRGRAGGLRGCHAGAGGRACTWARTAPAPPGCAPCQGRNPGLAPPEWDCYGTKSSRGTTKDGGWGWPPAGGPARGPAWSG